MRITVFGREVIMKNTIRVLLILGVMLGIMMSSVLAGRKYDKVAFLGVYTQTVDDDLAEDWELPVDYGVIINEVVENSAAEKPGWKKTTLLSLSTERTSGTVTTSPGVCAGMIPKRKSQ